MKTVTVHLGRALVPIAALGLVLVACGGDDESTTPTATPSSATSSPTAGPNPTPIPLEPALPSGVRELGGSFLTFQAGPGAPVEIDTIQAARDAGVDPPACAGFVFAAAWSADGPGASSMIVEAVVQGTPDVVSAGPADAATVGCSVLRFTVTDTAFLNVAFLVGALE